MAQFISLFIIFLVMFCFGAIVGDTMGIRSGTLKEQAIKSGHAYYHPQTGQFTWHETCITNR